MPETPTDKDIERVRQLLRLAKGTNFAPEAENARLRSIT